MRFEIQITTTDLLSFGQKNPRFFWGLSFFERVWEKLGLSQVTYLKQNNHMKRNQFFMLFHMGAGNIVPWTA